MTIVVTIVFLMCWCFQSLANLIRSIPGSTEWYGDPTMSQNSQESTMAGSQNSLNSCEKCELKRNFQTQAVSSNEIVQQPFLYKYSEWWRVFAYFNSCINPVLYFSISKSFKKQFLQFIGVAQVQKLSKRIKRRWNSSRGTFLLGNRLGIIFFENKRKTKTVFNKISWAANGVSFVTQNRSKVNVLICLLERLLYNNSAINYQNIVFFKTFVHFSKPSSISQNFHPFFFNFHHHL